MRTLTSELDESVNFIEQNGPEIIESRFVRRTPDYFIAYLSSQTGCKQACRFCHLTATGQTKDRNATLYEFEQQARNILEHHKSLDVLSPQVSYNFMARGEPLANPLVVETYPYLREKLFDMAIAYGLVPSAKVSSIIPKTFAGNLKNYMHSGSQLYYSLYSLSPSFRKRWMPNAMHPDKVGEQLYGVSENLVLHHTFIENENDSKHDVESILKWIDKYKIKCSFNTVRYNTASHRTGKETDMDIIVELDSIMRSSPNITGGRMVPRVGFDVKASCGMFV